MGVLLVVLVFVVIEVVDVFGVVMVVDVFGVLVDVILLFFILLIVSQMLYLDVLFNSMLCGLLLFIENWGWLQVSFEVLCQFGFNVSGDVLVYLDQISGVVVCYDVYMQILVLDVLLDQLVLLIMVFSWLQVCVLIGSVLFGVLFNYDVYGSWVDMFGNFSLSLELCVFGIGNGIFENIVISCCYQ